MTTTLNTATLLQTARHLLYAIEDETAEEASVARDAWATRNAIDANTAAATRTLVDALGETWRARAAAQGIKPGDDSFAGQQLEFIVGACATMEALGFREVSQQLAFLAMLASVGRDAFEKPEDKS